MLQLGDIGNLKVLEYQSWKDVGIVEVETTGQKWSLMTQKAEKAQTPCLLSYLIKFEIQSHSLVQVNLINQ